MAEYHFKLDNDESTVGTVIKVLYDEPWTEYDRFDSEMRINN